MVFSLCIVYCFNFYFFSVCIILISSFLIPGISSTTLIPLSVVVTSYGDSLSAKIYGFPIYCPMFLLPLIVSASFPNSLTWCFTIISNCYWISIYYRTYFFYFATFFCFIFSYNLFWCVCWNVIEKLNILFICMCISSKSQNRLVVLDNDLRLLFAQHLFLKFKMFLNQLSIGIMYPLLLLLFFICSFNIYHVIYITVSIFLTTL